MLSLRCALLSLLLAATPAIGMRLPQRGPTGVVNKSLDENGSPAEEVVLTEEANASLLEGVPAEWPQAGCRWLATKRCDPDPWRDDFNREPKGDKDCGVTPDKRSSGWCDCDGNGELNSEEPTFNCTDEKKTCNCACYGPGDGWCNPSSWYPRGVPPSTRRRRYQTWGTLKYR